MKAISLWQPWASALFTPLKMNETRSWPFPVSLLGERIFIHAAKKCDGEIRSTWSRVSHGSEHFAAIGIHRFDDLPLGCLIGTAVLARCVRTEDSGVKPGSDEFLWGDYTPGRYAWYLRNVVRLDKPIPYVGRQGFFNVEVSP